VNFAHGVIVSDGHGGELAVWKLKQTHLVFQNLPGGATNFDQDIPHLARITDGSDPLLKIEDGVQHKRTSAYVDYSGGDVFVNDYCPIQWIPPQPPLNGCMPSDTWHTGKATPVIRYVGDTTPTPNPIIVNVLKDHTTQNLDVKPDAVIWVGNLPMPGVHGPHHKEYLWLIENGHCMSGIKPLGDCTTTTDTTLINIAMNTLYPSDKSYPTDVGSPECTDSHFP
jgi:hypothetical protein